MKEGVEDPALVPLAREAEAEAEAATAVATAATAAAPEAEGVTVTLAVELEGAPTLAAAESLCRAREGGWAEEAPVPPTLAERARGRRLGDVAVSATRNSGESCSTIAIAIASSITEEEEEEDEGMEEELVAEEAVAVAVGLVLMLLGVWLSDMPTERAVVDDAMCRAPSAGVEAAELEEVAMGPRRGLVVPFKVIV